jgi:hypothetical protein
VRLIGAGNVEADRFSACCQQELVERHASSVRKRHSPRVRIDCGDLAAKLDGDRLILVELSRPERHPVFRRVSCEVIFRAIGPVVGRRIVRRNERHVAGKSFPPQHLRRGKSGSAATHDHHPFGRCARTFNLAHAPRLDLVAHEHRAVVLFHAPARHRAEGGRGDRLARGQTEAGMVPGASHGLADD